MFGAKVAEVGSELRQRAGKKRSLEEACWAEFAVPPARPSGEVGSSTPVHPQEWRSHLHQEELLSR